jgi:hypothetical protein
MKTQTTNDGDGLPETSATIHLCQPIRRIKRVACSLCGDLFGAPWIRFFYKADPESPTCKRCALAFGFVIRNPNGTTFRCQRGHGGAIELFATRGAMTIKREVTPPAGMTDRQLGDAIDRWLTRWQRRKRL